MKQKGLPRKLLTNTSVTRRQFMAQASLLGLTVATASSLWSSHARAASPQKGGHLVAALSGGATSDVMDQRTWTGTYMACVGRATRDSLVELSQDNEIVPALAESWEASDDATQWRFKLRPGVSFSNGKSVTPEDVINSINLHRGEESTSVAKSVFAGIEDVTADGNVVVVRLSGPNVDFPYLLTDYHMAVVPSIDGVADLSGEAGTGLYKVTEFRPGEYTTFERNPDAWQQDQFGFVNSAELLSVTDPFARQSSLLSGTVHAIDRPDPKTLNKLRETPDISVVDVASNFFYSAPMLTDQDPYSNVEFRRALKYGIDREAFVEKVLAGLGTPGNDHPIGPGFKYHAADLPQYTYDPDKAKHHLKKSGFEGAEIQFSAADAAFPGAVDFGVLMQKSLEAIGVNLTANRAPNDGYWVNTWNVKPFTACYWGSRPIEDMILTINFTSDAPWGDTRWGSARVDELTAAARGEFDEAKRAEMYREIQHIISQDGATIVPAYGRDVAAISNKVGTIGKYGGGWEMDGAHFVKRWWLTA